VILRGCEQSLLHASWQSEQTLSTDVRNPVCKYTDTDQAEKMGFSGSESKGRVWKKTWKKENGGIAKSRKSHCAPHWWVFVREN